MSGDPSDGDAWKPETWAAAAGRRPDWTRNREGTGGIVNPPVWRASTILYPSIADMDGVKERTFSPFRSFRLLMSWLQ